MKKYTYVTLIAVLFASLLTMGCSTICKYVPQLPFCDGPGRLDDNLRCLMVTDALLYNNEDAVKSVASRISRDWRYNCLLAMTAFGPLSGNPRNYIFQGCDEQGNVHPDLHRNISAVERQGVWVVPVIRCAWCYTHGKCAHTPLMDCNNAYGSVQNFNAAVEHFRQLVDKHPSIPAVQIELEASEGVAWCKQFVAVTRGFFKGKYIISIIGSQQGAADRVCAELGSDVLCGPSDINCWTQLAGANRDFLHGDGAELCNYAGGLDQLCRDLQARGKNYAIWPRDGVMGHVPPNWLIQTAVPSVHAAVYSGPIADEDRP